MSDMKNRYFGTDGIRGRVGDTPVTADFMLRLGRAAGKVLAFDRNVGNCLSCHMIPEGELPGNVGPPLIQMKLRFPDRAVLRAQIWDAAIRNPNTVMPPYGRHSILTEAEIDRVVDFVLTI